MQIVHGATDTQAITDLFQQTFTASEGEAEGALIGQLVRDLLTNTAPDDIHVFQGQSAGDLVAAAIFTRLTYPDDPKTVFILSPMAVAPDHQRKGLGQSLLNAALKTLRNQGVDVAITYGDPAYYSKVGFHPMTVEQAQPPLALSMPFGWIGQALNDGSAPVLNGPSTCVPALNRPDIW